MGIGIYLMLICGRSFWKPLLTQILVIGDCVNVNKNTNSTALINGVAQIARKGGRYRMLRAPFGGARFFSIKLQVVRGLLFPPTRLVPRGASARKTKAGKHEKIHTATDIHFLR